MTEEAIQSNQSDKLLGTERKSEGANYERTTQQLEEEFFGKKEEGSNLVGEDNEIRKTENIMAAATPPMSPGKRILRVVGSPGRYIKTTMRKGSPGSSTFSLVVVCLGAGTLTIPYAFFENGFVVGSICIILGGFLSAFTGYLVVITAHKTQAACYEEIALATFGPTYQKITSICMIPCNMGFVVSYMVLFKSFAPFVLGLAGAELPGWCDDSRTGQIFWAVLFTIICTFVCLPRDISTLRFASALSVLISFFVVLTVVFEAVLLRGTATSLAEGFKQGHQKAELSVKGIFNSLPLIIFSYMYQVNIPAIYDEMENKDPQQAKKVIIYGTILAAIAYMFCGIFGYIAFADGSTPAQLDLYFSNNILAAPYVTPSGNTPIPIFICLFGMMVVVTFATPFCVLPCKDSIEEVRQRKFEPKDNYFWTILLVWIAGAISCIFSDIKTVMQILGATTNSAIGFLFPVAYYLKMEKRSSPYTNMKMVCYFVFGFICISSVIELVTMTLDLIDK